MQETFQQIQDELLTQAVAEGCFPGAVMACGTAKEVYAVSWAGKLSTQGPDVDRSTCYDMASVTKILGPTILALQALDRGDLTLYDRLDRYFPDAPEDKRGITILQLMTHTAGFEPTCRLDKLCRTPEEVLPTILSRPLATYPGEAPHYSCMGYILLGKLLEKLYGVGLDVLCHERVFKPLGMQHTGFRPADGLPAHGNIAPTEIDPTTGLAWQGVVHDENARFLHGVAGNAGIFSCIDDMILYAQALAANDGRLVSPAALNRAIRNHTPGFDVHRGLGFHLAGTPLNYMGDLFPQDSFGHNGFTGPSVAIDPHTGFFVIILANRVHPTRDNDGIFRFRRAAHNRLYAEMSRLSR